MQPAFELPSHPVGHSQRIHGTFVLPISLQSLSVGRLCFDHHPGTGQPSAEKPFMEVVNQRPGGKRHLVNPIYRGIQFDDHCQVIERRAAYRWVVAKPGGQPVGGQSFSSEPADHVPYWKSSESPQGGQPQLYQHISQLGAI
jgi:hypothetical protein